MKKLLLFTTLFLAFACSKDDGDDNSSDSQKFLTKYNNTSWLYQEEGYGDDYLFFSSNSPQLKAVEIYSGENYCEQYKIGINNIEGETIEVTIITEEEDRLVIDFSEDGENFRYIFEVNGDILELTDDEGYTDTYNKTTTSFSSLCN